MSLEKFCKYHRIMKEKFIIKHGPVPEACQDTDPEAHLFCTFFGDIAVQCSYSADELISLNSHPIVAHRDEKGAVYGICRYFASYN